MRIPTKRKLWIRTGFGRRLLRSYLKSFCSFFIPELHGEVDFKHGVVFLDKELFQEVVDEKKGRHYADQLAKVQLKNGEKKWVLIHVEVQSSRESEFSERMFKYFYRIYDRHKEKIVALAVHTTRENIGKMKHFQYDYFGTALNYSYNNYRVEDYTNEELGHSNNIFSRVVLAAKAMHETKGKVEKRYQFKRKLMRELIRSKRYSRTAIVATIFFVDYLLQLPKEDTRRLGQEIGGEIRKERGIMELYNEENAPPTVLNSFAEQLDRSIAKGIEQGLERGLEQGIDLGVEKAASKMLQMGLDLEVVSEATGLSLERVRALEQEMEE